MTEGEKQPVKGEWGDLQRTEEREGERRLGERPYGEQRGVVREGGSDPVRAGEIFLVHF